MRTRVALAVLLLVATLAACTSKEAGCDTSTTGSVECPIDKRPAAPALAGELLEGGRYDLSQDRGQVVVVNFWGSWCAPCRAEIDDLEQVYQATKDRGVRFLGINVRDEKDKAKAFHSGKASYPSVLDPASKLALDFDIPPNTIPATIVIDRKGRIAVVIREAVLAADFEPVVARVAAEAS